MNVVGFVYSFMFVILRVGAVFVTTPFFNSNRIPSYIKVAIIMMVTYFITSIRDTNMYIGSSVDLFPIVFNELFIGFIIGFTVSILYYSVFLTGHFIDFVSGLMLAASYDPVHNTKSSLYGKLYNAMFALIFVIFNAHYFIIDALVKSYDLVPNYSNSEAILLYILNLLKYSFVIGVQLAAPIVIIIFLTDITVGLISRTIPQINMFIIGSPIKLLLSFVVTMMLINPIVFKMVDIVEIIIVELNNIMQIM